MRQAITYMSLWILLSWLGYALLGWIMEGPLALALGAGTAGLCLLVFHRSLAIGVFTALLEPIGIALPLVAVWHMAGAFGFSQAALSVPELIIFTLTYLVFLLSAFGVIRMDFYRFGYTPLFVGTLVLVLCAYGLISGNIFVPGLAVVGQLTWILRWGSSNWFDHVLHLFLLPIAVIELLARVI